MKTHSTITEEYTIRSYEADINAKATIQTIGNYFQNIGLNHALNLQQHLGIENDPNLAFVLTRLRIKIERYPFWRETVTINSWLSPIVDMFAVRDFEMLDGSGNIIGTGTNSAVFFNLAERKPIHVTEGFMKIPSPDRPRALDDPFEKLPVMEKADYSRTFNVRQSDLDMYRHVNNVIFIEWAVEAIPEDIIKCRRLCDMEINFKAESDFGDRIISQAQKIDNGDEMVFLHKLVREADNRTVAVLRTKWKD